MKYELSRNGKIIASLVLTLLCIVIVMAGCKIIGKIIEKHDINRLENPNNEY